MSDNLAVLRGWTAEHGLSLLLTLPNGRRILFDTGQGLVLDNNLGRAEVRPEDIETVALSHGHFDHGGGLNWFFGKSHRPTLFAHPGVFQKRWRMGSSPGGGPDPTEGTEVSVPWTREQISRNLELSLSREIQDLGDGVFLSGEIPRENPEEEGKPGFVILQDGKMVPDPLLDDACLWVDGPEERIVLLGCAHSGVINTLDHITRNAGSKPISLLIGGMHLHSAAPDRLAWTATKLRDCGVRKVIPLHCTGFGASAYLAGELKDRVVFAGTGNTVLNDGRLV